MNSGATAFVYVALRLLAALIIGVVARAGSPDPSWLGVSGALALYLAWNLWQLRELSFLAAASQRRRSARCDGAVGRRGRAGRAPASSQAIPQGAAHAPVPRAAPLDRRDARWRRHARSRRRNRLVQPQGRRTARPVAARGSRTAHRQSRAPSGFRAVPARRQLLAARDRAHRYAAPNGSSRSSSSPTARTSAC